MAKKASDPETDETNETAAVEPGEMSSVDDLPYEIGQWHGIPQYRCKLCPWDTLDGELAMFQHIADRHLPKKAAPPTPTIPVYDRWGNEVKPAA